MTLLGKIFSLLIFIACIGLMTASVCTYMTHKNWKAEVTRPRSEAVGGKQVGLIFQKDDLEKQIEELRTQLRVKETELRREKAARANALAVLEEAYQAEKALREQGDEANAILAASQRTAIAAMNATQGRLDSTVAEVAALRGSIRTAQQETDAKREDVVMMTDLVNQAADKERQLKERQTALVAQIARMKAVLDKHGLNIDTPLNDIPPPLDGIVLAVKNDFIEISLGSDDGLREGHQLDVFAGGAFKGRVTVRKVDPDRAVAEINRDILKGDIERGQFVRTRKTS